MGDWINNPPSQFAQRVALKLPIAVSAFDLYNVAKAIDATVAEAVRAERAERDRLRAENEAKDRVIERLRKERDDAVSHLIQVRRPLIPGGSRG